MRRALCLAAGSIVLASRLAAQGTPGEVRATHALEAAKKLGAPSVYALLESFPKGADLHMHLSGAVYAETFLDEAARAGMCVDLTAHKLVQPASRGVCPQGTATAADAVQSSIAYTSLIDAFSMRSFVPSAGVSGHDQFFATFDRFGGLKAFDGEWLDEVANRAASQNEQYLEIMQTPGFGKAIEIAGKLGWPTNAATNVTPQELAGLRTAMLALGLHDAAGAAAGELKASKARREAVGHCGTPAADAGCKVTIHWLYQVLRENAPALVFAQTLQGFEAASMDDDIVGINFVQPEDGRISMRDYHLQMQMIAYLHSVYPKVHISLHAGEVMPGLVTPDGVRFHIREAVELAHAERIGHGVDVLFEDDAAALLKEMAAQHVMVEINLTSNDVILGVKGSEHPLVRYRGAKVPWALSTDDEGVSRINLTNEYVRSVMEQGLSYADLKQSARDSLEYSFLHGASLYAARGAWGRVAECATPVGAETKPAGACAEYLKANEKAAAEWELERRFAVFEAQTK